MSIACRKYFIDFQQDKTAFFKKKVVRFNRQNHFWAKKCHFSNRGNKGGGKDFSEKKGVRCVPLRK